jgi:hypothetical protein
MYLHWDYYVTIRACIQQRLALLVVEVISDQEFVADSCCGVFHRIYGDS